MAKLDLKLTEARPRPPVIVPGSLATSDTIEQPREVPPPWFGNRVYERPIYDQPLGSMPVGYPTPTRPINPQPAKPPNASSKR